MSSKKQKVCLIICLLLISVPFSAAAAEYPSARAYAMGGAYTAIVSDISALQINPAGLGQSDLELTLGTSVGGMNVLGSLEDTWADLQSRDMVLQGQAGARLGSLAVGLFVDGVAEASDTEEDVAVRNISARASAGIGLKLLALPLNIGSLRVGVSADKIAESTDKIVIDSESEPTVTLSKDGYALNAGVLARLGFITVGVSAKDVYGSVSQTSGGTTTEVKLDPLYRAGVAVKLPILGIIIAGDMELPPGVPAGDDMQALIDASTMHYGAEASILFFKLRAGQVKSPDDVTLTTLGAGVQIGPLCADLAVGSKDEFKSQNLDNAMLQLSIKF